MFTCTSIRDLLARQDMLRLSIFWIRATAYRDLCYSETTMTVEIAPVMEGGHA